MELDISNRISAIKIVTKTFTNESGREIEYKQLVLTVLINGNQEDITIPKVPQDKLLLLQLATDLDSDLITAPTK